MVKDLELLLLVKELHSNPFRIVCTRMTNDKCILEPSFNVYISNITL